MRRAAVHHARASLFLLAAHGCSGYVDGSLQAAQAAPASKPSPTPADVPLPAPPERPRPVSAPTPDAGEPNRHAPDAMMASEPAHAPDVKPTPDVKPASEMKPAPDVHAPDAMLPAAPASTVRIASTASFDAYLTDAVGRALYMYARDVPGSPDSACTGDCVRQWPAFDTVSAVVEPPLQAADFTRFHRQDGAFQTAYKGHPLYYRTGELNTRAVTADGLELRWFVARDYLLFLAAANSFAPLRGSAGDGVYLTDGFGRAVYVCLDDMPRTAASPAETSCGADCLVERPIFGAAQTERTTRLPSVLDVTDLDELVRPDGQQQLTYRGWPLYYFSGDATAGAPQGHNERAWRVFDPIQFGRTEQPDLPEP